MKSVLHSSNQSGISEVRKLKIETRKKRENLSNFEKLVFN